ncbi:MAG: V-type ATPase subunit [Thermoprotei archaeon]
MPDMIWTGTFGKLKVLSTSFLSKEFLLSLARLKDVKEVVQALESTWYAPYIEEAGAKYSPPDQVEVALNRHLVVLNSFALNSAPPYDKNTVRAYLSKWDVYNIELILAAKSVGRSIGETEAFLVSSRNMPVGVAGGLIPFSELRSLLELPDVEAVVESLVKYGYGAVLLQRLPDYQKSRDLGVLSGALYSEYYSKLLWELRFRRGDEGVLREYVRAEIAKRNILNFFKAREAGVERERLEKHLVDGGLIPTQSVLELYTTPTAEVGQKLQGVFNIGDALQAYESTKNLAELEVALDRELGARYVGRMRSSSLSTVYVFWFLLQAEYERNNIRRIVYGKHYGLSEENIRRLLLLVE